MENEIFKKRSGATDHGRDYEDLFVAHIILEMVTDENVKDFKLSSNDEKFGAFDDVVLETTAKDGCKQNYALQLKFSGRPLTKENLCGKSGDFSIKKYFNNFTKLKNTKNEIDYESFRWILYTNRDFNLNKNKKIRLEDDSFDIKILECQPETIFTKSLIGGGCYGFRAKGTTCIYQEFFNKFFLYTNQSNDDGLRNKIFNNLQKNFSCGKNNYTEYLNFIIEWNKREGKKEKLNKTMMKQTIAMCLLSPFLQPIFFAKSSSQINPKAKILREAISKFNITTFEEENYGRIVTTLADVKNEFAKIHIKQINKTGRKFQVTSQYVTNINDLKDEECCKLMWLMDICPLIVVENQCVLKAIDLCKNKNLILLCKKPFTENIQGVSTFRNLSDLKTEQDLYQELVTTFICSLQGKEEIILEKLIGESHEIENIITTNELLLMVGATFVIGEEKEDLPETYIERSLSKHIIDYKFLKKLDDMTVVVISGVIKMNKCISSSAVNIDEILDKSTHKEVKTNIYISQNEFSQETFDKICKKIPEKKKYHHFRIVDEGLEWIRSRGGVSDLQEYKIGNCFISEQKLFNYDEDDNNIDLICENPGMGKSTLMKNLKNSNSPSLWTILIYPKDYSVHFRENGHNTDKFTEYILKNKRKEYRNSNVFEVFFKTGRVNYIWDGLDEITERSLQIVTTVIAELSKRNFKQWITSRSNLKSILENKFNVLSRTIRQFDVEDQERYIKQRLKCSDDEMQEIFNKIKTNIELFRNNQILGIPLQIYMFTELFCQNPKKYKTVVDSLFTLTDLYNHFVQEKFNIYNKKRNYDIENDLAYEENEEIRNDRIDNYEKVAIKTYFYHVAFHNLDCGKFLEKIKNGKDPVGIITAVSEENIPNFLHSSYGEYFAASFLSKHPEMVFKLEDSIFDEKFRNIRFMFDSILAKGHPAHIAVLYRNLEDLRRCGEDQLNNKDRGGRNTLQLACSYGRRYSDLKTISILEGKLTAYKVTKSEIVKENPEYRNILEYLIDICNPEEEDVIFKLNSFEYADRAFCLFSLTLVSSKRKVNFKDLKNLSLPLILYCSVVFDIHNIFDTLKQIPFVCSYNNFSLLHLSVNYGSVRCLKKLIVSHTYRDIFQKAEEKQRLMLLSCEKEQLEIVNFLLENGAIVNSIAQFQSGPLHVACKGGNTELVKLLIKRGANVNSVNEYSKTPIQLAWHFRKFNIVKILVNHGADVNSMNEYNETSLHLAFQYGNIDIVKFLIEHGADPNSANENGETPLHSAFHYGNSEMVKLLIECGASVNSVNKYNVTPLHLAFQFGNIEIVKLLIEKGANVNSENEYNKALLHLAWQYGDPEIVKLLINHGADVNSVNEYKETLLHLACPYGNTEIVKLLAEHGADVNSISEYNDIPLHLAFEYGNIEIVKLLIEHGANVNSVSKYNETPLHLAIQHGNIEIVKMLIEHDADVNSINEYNKTPLNLAFQYGNNEIVKLLIEHGASVNSTNEYNETSLHFACQNGHVEIVNLLIEHGANVNSVSEFNESPLHLAFQYGNIEIVKILIEHGASVNSTNEYNNKPLHLACEKRNSEIVNLLIKHGAEVNSENEYNQTPLHFACQSGNIEIVTVLIEHGAHVNSVSDCNETPLHIAFQYGNSEITKYLIDHGADVNSKNDYDETPLHLALQYGNTEIVKLLIEYSASVNSVNKNSNSPLHLACQNKNTDIVKLLIEHGGNVNCMNEYKETPIHLACQHGDNEIVKLLINYGAKVNSMDTNNCTPLHLASQYGNTEIVTLLIRHGANFNTPDKDDNTPLHEAYRYKKYEIIRLLTACGAKDDVKNVDGKTPQEMDS